MEETIKLSQVKRVELAGRGVIEYLDIDAPADAVRNPKEHDEPNIARSMARWGYTEAVVYDLKRKRLVSGHGRVGVLRSLRDEGAQPPEDVWVDDDGRWHVIAIGKHFKNAKEAEAYVLAANRLVETGGWHAGRLAEILDDMKSRDALDGVGYTSEQVDQILEYVQAGKDARGTEQPPDEFPEIDVDAADRITMVECPHCGGEVPV